MSTSLFERLKKEDNPEILRSLLALAIEHNTRLEGRISKYEEAAAKEAQLQLEMEQKYTLLRRLFFRRGTEKLDPARDREKDERALLLFSQSLVPDLKPKDKEDLEVVEEAFSADDAALNAQLSGRIPGLDTTGIKWRRLTGLDEVAEEITVIERKYVRKRYKRAKYKATIVDPATHEEKEVILTAPGPQKILPGSGYSVDFALSVVGDKYLAHLPLERQRRQMQALGLKNVTTKTLWNLCWATSEHLRPVYERIAADVKACGLCVHVDETPWPIHNKKDSNGHVWAFTNQAGAYYVFEPTRSGRIAEEFFTGFQGAMQSDAYSGYNRLKEYPGIVVSNCWAHARRKFFELAENNPGHEAETGIRIIDEIFAVERRAHTAAELLELRRAESKPLVQKLRDWIEQLWPQTMPQSGLRKASAYVLNHWAELTVFLSDARVPLSNNDVERALRHAVVGRKNYYGSQSINGADAAAVLFSVIESCKRVGLEPRAYLKMAVTINIQGQHVQTPLEYAKSLASTQNPQP